MTVGLGEMPMMRHAVISMLLVLCAGVAAAQDNTVRMTIPQSSPLPEDQVRVTVSMGLPVPGISGNDNALEAQEQARRKAYELAAHECAVLGGTIASECRVESMNVNVNANTYANRYQSSSSSNAWVAVNATYRIKLK
jgi:hypothetical protein